MLKNAFWLFLFTIVLLLVFLPSYTKMQDLRQKNLEYDLQIKFLKDKQVRLQEEERMLREDPVYLEKVAREKMGLIREGEVIYKITTKSAETDEPEQVSPDPHTKLPPPPKTGNTIQD